MTSDLEDADARLLQIVDGDLHAGAVRAGSRLACRPGCSECCIGPFPITRLDAWRMRRGLEALDRAEPDVAEGVRLRARQAVEALAPDFPGDAERGLLDGVDVQEDVFFESHAGLPCPALDPAAGTCLLYAYRPITCRTFGGPVRIAGEDLPPCRLCFVGAPADEIDRCRVEPDRSGIEDAILEGMEALDGEERETLIAYALAFPAT